MRTTLLLFFLGILAGNAQFNFNIQNNSIEWEKVYKVNFTKESLERQLLKNSTISAIDKTESTWFILVKDLTLDYATLGRKEFTTSMYVTRNNFSFSARIDFKEGRYKVLITDIYALMDYSDGLNQQGSKNMLNFFALKKNNTVFRKGFLKNDAEIFDFNFNKIFYFKPVEENKEW